MSRVPHALRPYANCVLAVWSVLAVACMEYGTGKHIPIWVSTPVIAALMCESALYVFSGFAVRDWVAERSPVMLRAGILAASAPLSYLIYSIPTEVFSFVSFAALLGIGIALSYWFVAVPRSRVADLVFVAGVAALVLAKVLPDLYARPWEKLPTEVLGQGMVIRIGILAVLWFRRMDGIGFGFWPTRQEWLEGLRQFAWLAPVAGIAGAAVGFFEPNLHPGGPPVVAGKLILTFFGMLWVVALSEEFFFRGLLLQWFSGWLGNPWASLAVTSVLFGAVHLPFRGFPNWRFFLVASIAGWFYGRAYQRAGSIRASMVTHALTAAIWKVLLA